MSTLHTSANSPECPSNLGLKTVGPAAPTSTVFDVGDRVVITVELSNVGGRWGGDSSRTFSMGYDGSGGSSGDSFVNFSDTLSFGGDSANGRPSVQ